MNTTSEYLLLFRGTSWQKELSAQELETHLGRFKAWFDEIQASGKLKGANPLLPGGKVLSGVRGRTITDGPFAESKETIGGYFLVTADDLDEAVAIAQGCPVLDFGGRVEVRPVAAECPLMEDLRAKAELAHA